MHPNPAFRQTPEARSIAFARSRGFGMLCLNGDAAPLISHVPFVLAETGTEARLHLVRSNLIAGVVEAPTSAVIAVTGPDSYISPDWYGDPAQVPTWNYVAVHLRGQIEPLPQEALRADLDLLSAHFESRLAPKPEWTAEKMPPEALDRMMRMIRPFRFSLTQIDGTWKLNQNKPDALRLAAAEAVARSGQGVEIEQLAQLMAAIPSS
ncbi:FMN-binding negative transcriptional regulator [Pseudoruegeria sp. SHC-113]|uniref:FMN-binding negative transcriptional regulator n=1 Tax=Pseudoruegeria sp. SHC-113 TaxID=2855439 RepID=UPI0021BBA11D|nr:FMN-binding negative transcriptional regulator [Pseudoruegeria sp. SHC-113]MCT8158741.1 FMN-binding negative transcriptional regulator [Pseudoruegeria sp. SHC-113]